MPEVPTDPSPRRAFLLWFLIGTAAAAILQIGQARVMGGVPEGLLFAGTWQDVHPLVVEELPRTPVFEGHGHDGQIFYAVALDLRGDWVPDTLLSAPYRYRRILYPAVASGLGAMGGQGLLWGMISLASLSVGVAAGAVALIASRLQLPRWSPVVVLLNPGMWLSARMLTADNLALALGLLAVLAFLRRRDGWAVAALAGAALAKEPTLAFALGLAAYAWSQGQRRRSLALLAGGAVPMLAWWAYVGAAIGSPLDSGGNVVAPLMGIVDSIPVWPNQRPRDWFYLLAVLVGVACAVWVVARGRRLWAWLVAPWLLIAVVSSHLVWHLGNNAIRALGPVLVLGVIGVLAGSRHREEATATPASP